ncbi:hypothetical protein L6R52_24940 [Myxococcota bacterium]|nr:hypothetical protein [Myxococcota bacterium]
MQSFVRLTVIIFVAYLVPFHLLTNLPLDPPLFLAVVARFWIQANVIVFLWAGLGLARFAPRLGRLALPLAIAVVAAACALRFSAQDQRANDLLRRYAEDMLAPLPKGALVLTRGDVVTNSVRYVRYVEGVREDLALLDLEMATFPWMAPLVAKLHPDVVIPGRRYYPNEPGAYDLATLLAANVERRRVILCGKKKDGDPSADVAWVMRPIGLCDELVPAARADDFDTWARTSAETRPALGAWPRDLARESWEAVARDTVAEAVHRHALRALEHAIANGNDARALRLAAAGFDELLAHEPRPLAAVLKNAGITYNRLAQHDPAATEKMIQAWRRFVRDAPSDPDAAAVRQALAPYGG